MMLVGRHLIFWELISSGLLTSVEIWAVINCQVFLLLHEILPDLQCRSGLCHAYRSYSPKKRSLTYVSNILFCSLQMQFQITLCNLVSIDKFLIYFYRFCLNCFTCVWIKHYFRKIAKTISFLPCSYPFHIVHISCIHHVLLPFCSHFIFIAFHHVHHNMSGSMSVPRWYRFMLTHHYWFILFILLYAMYRF